MFPDSTSSARNFFKNLQKLLGQLPNANVTDSSIEMYASQPAHSLPATIFRQADVAFPQLHFDGNVEESLTVGNLQINPSPTGISRVVGKPFEAVTKQDSLGVYCELQPSSLGLFRLPLEELCSRLDGHVIRIDHTGINLPTKLVTSDEWQHFIQYIAQQANVYNYPTGENWPFILPATREEHDSDITHFPIGREPKFEIVYDSFSPVPTIQIDVETDFERKEIERLFPQPYGISFPDLADFFRTVYIHHEWPGLNVRFDLRFKNDEPVGDWETGKWLVKDGGRIRV